MHQFRRPLGISILSLAAYSVSAGLAWICIRSSILSFPLIKERPMYASDLSRHYWGLAAVGVFHACLLILALISFVAGGDLWRLRVRGRRLAVTGMVLLFPIALLYAMSGSAHDGAQRLITTIYLIVFGMIALGYLSLPGVKRSFTWSTNPTS
jgi:hypothetical protein